MILDESLFESETTVNEQTMTQREAMDRCISLGKQFIEHFDKIYNGKNEGTNKRHAQEMQDCLEQVNRIKLTHNNRSIPFDKKIDWFFTAGSDADTLFDDVRESEKFDDFFALVAVNNDVIKSLKSLGMLKENVSEDMVEKLSDAGYKPNKTGTAYKVFRVKNGKLYPPMVANRNNEPTPIGVWLDAEEGEFAGLSKTGRPQVKSKGSTLAYRPGWHLGDVPRAKQFDRTNKETGEKEFPADFVWAECEYAMDVDYQDEADARGYERTKVDDEGNVIVTKSDKYQHSLAGLPKLPKDGYYKYRTNPNPDTVPWVITGQIKVNRLLDDFEVNEILKRAGVAPIHRQGGDKTLAELGLNNLSESISEDVIISTEGTEEKTIEPENNGISMIINNLIKDEYEAIDAYNSAITTFKDIGNSDNAISVLNDIVAEENIHVGQLQRLMELFDPNADKVSDGVEEASEQIENDLDMSDEEFLEKFAEWYDPTKGNSSNYDTSAIPNYSNPVNESAGTDNIVDMSCSNCTDDADEDEFLKGFESLMNR